MVVIGVFVTLYKRPFIKCHKQGIRLKIDLSGILMKADPFNLKLFRDLTNQHRNRGSAGQKLRGEYGIFVLSDYQ
jgi:hypothetical protein